MANKTNKRKLYLIMFFELKVNAYRIVANDDGTAQAGFFCDQEELRKMLDRIKEKDLLDYLRIHRNIKV